MRSRTALLPALLIILFAVISLAIESRSDESRGAVRLSGRQIEFPAVVTAGAFAREVLGMPGYHLIVWKDGRAAMAALFRAEVTDTEVLDALERLGAKPGNALGMATWEE